MNRKPRTLLRALVILCVLAMLVVIAIYVLLQRSYGRFKDTYTVYAAAEARYETAAFKPAVESNPIRQEVNALLSEVLQVDMGAEARLDRARRGISHLNDIEGQIDDIKEEGDLVAPLLAELESTASSPLNWRERSAMQDLVALGHERARIIGDIRGLSYRANFYSGEVFERIIDDQGDLTDDHVRHLNDLIPQLEEQFDARSALYDELERTGNRMDQIAAELGIAQAIRE